MPKFINGLDLSHAFYRDVIRPILEQHDTELEYAAGLIGRGSEVLGYDDKMSTDHDWGPSVTLFFKYEDAHLIPMIQELLRHELPHHFRGYSTNFMPAPESPNNQVMTITTRGAVNHNVKPITVRDYFEQMLGWIPVEEIDVVDWLTFPSHKLRALTSGAVFHDGIGELTHIRAQLGWYPDDVWLYLMMAQWSRIGEEEHLMGRAGYRGDDLGATIIANRLVNDVMRLCFLFAKEFAPYPKWFGRAFTDLPMASTLTPMLQALQQADNWETRQSAYTGIIEFMLDQHNQLGITKPLDVRAKQFHTRPFYVADGGAVANALRQNITDSEVLRLFSLPTPIGSLDQISDETSLKEFASWRQRLKQFYQT
ncbi:MAG: DUF4037 domain-containing protein [Chloroflexota bacterium]